MPRSLVYASIAPLVAFALLAGSADAQDQGPETSFTTDAECEISETEIVDIEVESAGGSSIWAHPIQEFRQQLERRISKFVVRRFGNNTNAHIQNVRRHLCPVVDRVREERQQRDDSRLRIIGRMCLVAAECAAQKLGAPPMVCVTTVRLAGRTTNALCPPNWRELGGRSRL